MRLRQTGLYLLVLLLGFLVVVVALGGGLFKQEAPWYMQWQHQAFMTLCHQMPERSFGLGGQPMAVCSRCIGVYSGFLVGWGIIPFSSKFNLGEKVAMKKAALLMLLLNFFDIVGNVLGFWENTLASRLVLGILMGGFGALIFSGDFFDITITSKESHHGRIKAADIS